MQKKIIINTYRRSGTVFLSTHISSALNILVEAHHHPVSTKNPTVSMVREPVESIASSVVLDIHGRNTTDFEYIANYEIRKYEFFTNYLLKTDRLIFDFKDIHKIDMIIDSVSKTFGISYREEKIIPNLERSDSHLLTSKDHGMYGDVVSFLKKSDLSSCYQAYDNAILLKTIL